MRRAAALVLIVCTACAGGPDRSAAMRSESAVPNTSGPYFRTTEGTTDRRCVDVDALLHSGAGMGTGRNRVLDVRSGEIVAGNFANLAGAGEPGDLDFVAKIYYVPLRTDVAEKGRLLVKIVNLADPDGGTITQRFGGPGRWAQTTEGDYFWATGTRLPGHGHWRITAQASGHWGCWVTST